MRNLLARSSEVSRVRAGAPADGVAENGSRLEIRRRGQGLAWKRKRRPLEMISRNHLAHRSLAYHMRSRHAPCDVPSRSRLSARSLSGE